MEMNKQDIKEHNAKFKNGYGVIMNTSKWNDLGLDGFVCKLLEHTGKEFDFDKYVAKVEYSNCEPLIIEITTAEMNPVSMEFLAVKSNTHLYNWKKPNIPHKCH